ncbi:MAG: hypothetical protein C4324_05645 [Blastocatellia bacterium]
MLPELGNIQRVLVIRLRSIGDSVLATPSLAALRRNLPNARIDILLEDWVAPLLVGLDEVNNVIPVGKSIASRLAVAKRIRAAGYDLVFDLHGGPTAAFFTLASGARQRIGYRHYRFPRVYTICPENAATIWPVERLHSAEQQLALIAAAGLRVSHRPRSRLVVTEEAIASVEKKIPVFKEVLANPEKRFALLHPAATFDTKRWPPENFARVAEYLAMNKIDSVAIAAEGESEILRQISSLQASGLTTAANLTLPEITALASRAAIFIGNDSGIAHIAAAVGSPCVVVFGSSNRDNWRPWTDAPSEIVFSYFECQPCPGYRCEKFESPRCILSVTPESVIAAIERVLERAANFERELEPAV